MTNYLNTTSKVQIQSRKVNSKICNFVSWTIKYRKQFLFHSHFGDIAVSFIASFFALQPSWENFQPKKILQTSQKFTSSLSQTNFVDTFSFVYEQNNITLDTLMISKQIVFLRQLVFCLCHCDFLRYMHIGIYKLGCILPQILWGQTYCTPLLGYIVKISKFLPVNKVQKNAKSFVQVFKSIRCTQKQLKQSQRILICDQINNFFQQFHAQKFCKV
eukprot:TRINITY_DN931_c0_g2_i2.p4 TRINITY_DN931_c0_g2~~TRINITY_DN931_c0_g2_i2.p4  ORF type:complete len:216 (-),score=-14.99 TRINITY_DN931_c0_g2_i2:679-1326(-)